MRPIGMFDVANAEKEGQSATAQLALADLLAEGLYERLEVVERLYVALVLRRDDLLRVEGVSTMEALAVLPERWANRLLTSWFAEASPTGMTTRVADDREEEPSEPGPTLH